MKRIGNVFVKCSNRDALKRKIKMSVSTINNNDIRYALQIHKRCTVIRIITLLHNRT